MGKKSCLINDKLMVSVAIDTLTHIVNRLFLSHEKPPQMASFGLYWLLNSHSHETNILRL